MREPIATTKLYKIRTTVPKDIRAVLNIEDGDEIVWFIDEYGDVIIKKKRIPYVKQPSDIVTF